MKQVVKTFWGSSMDDEINEYLSKNPKMSIQMISSSSVNEYRGLSTAFTTVVFVENDCSKSVSEEEEEKDISGSTEKNIPEHNRFTVTEDFFS